VEDFVLSLGDSEDSACAAVATQPEVGKHLVWRSAGDGLDCCDCDFVGGVALESINADIF
jgi:hypothetical protein